jgi:hypothetical protein
MADANHGQLQGANAGDLVVLDHWHRGLRFLGPAEVCGYPYNHAPVDSRAPFAAVEPPQAFG